MGIWWYWSLGWRRCENRKTLDGRWDTNDTRDAANVADLMSQGKCLFYEFPVGPLQDLRNLLSLKRRFKRVEHGYRVRIRNHLLAKYFPELDRYYEQSAPTDLAIVRWCLDPSVIAGLEYKEFVREGRFGPEAVVAREAVAGDLEDGGGFGGVRGGAGGGI